MKESPVETYSMPHAPTGSWFQGDQTPREERLVVDQHLPRTSVAEVIIPCTAFPTNYSCDLGKVMPWRSWWDLKSIETLALPRSEWNCASSTNHLLKLLNFPRDTWPLISEPDQPQSSGVEVAKMIRFSRYTFRNDAKMDEIETKKLFTETMIASWLHCKKHNLASKTINSQGFNMGRWIRNL